MKTPALLGLLAVVALGANASGQRTAQSQLRSPLEVRGQPQRSAKCPPTNLVAGNTALTLFAPGRFGWFKDKYGFRSVSFRRIRPLDDRQVKSDADVCATLLAGVKTGPFAEPTTRITFFRADSLYLAVFVDGRDPATATLWHPQVFVFDSKLRFITSVMPKTT